jgi:hypothetical protein
MHYARSDFYTLKVVAKNANEAKIQKILCYGISGTRSG